MKIAIHGRNFTEPIKPFIQGLFDFFAHKNIALQLSAGFAELLASSGVRPHTQNVYRNSSELFDANFVITVGGDGTLLDAVTHVGGRGIPILGINTGRLGFLATVSPKDIQNSLALVFQKQFDIEERSLLNLDAGSELFGEANFALNDVVITKTDISSMITIHTYLDGDFLNSYWADGLIISTPTGSTGYSLSCGGPVLLPHNSNFIITPISPHNLNVRPMIIPDSSQLSCKIESRSNNFLVSLDSRFKIIETSVELHIKKEAFNARLVKMPQDNFIETLRTKLHWGLDARN